jgi:hypothetical protein
MSALGDTAATTAAAAGPLAAGDIPVAIPPTPANQIISTQQQQAAANGQPSPPTQGQQAAQTHQGLAAKLAGQIAAASVEDYDREFGRQQAVDTNYDEDKAKAYMDAENHSLKLRVYGVMIKGSTKVNIVWGFGKCEEEAAQLGDTTLAFLGDRDEFDNMPSMYGLPKDNGYKWAGLEAVYDEGAFTTFYNDAGNANKYRPVPTRTTGAGTKTTVNLPRLILLPFEAGLGAVSEECTPAELFEEVTRLEGETTCKITTQHSVLIKNWLMGASQKGTGNNSALAVELKTITVNSKEYRLYKQLKGEWMLGRSTAMANSPAAVQGQNTVADQRLDQMGRLVERSMAAMEALAKSNNNQSPPQQQQQSQQQSQPGNPLMSIKRLEGSLGAAVCGWSGVIDVKDVPKAWLSLLSSKPLMDKRDDILEGVIAWGQARNYPVNEDYFLDKLFFTDMATGDLAVGEARATEYNIDRGFTPQWTLDTTLAFKRKKKDEEDAEDDTQHTRTMGEKLSLTKVASRKPPETLEELKVNTATFTGLTFVCFGSGCDLYQKLEAICATLHSPTVRQIKSLLTPLAIKQYHFALCNAARQFFYHRCKPSEFADGAIPIFPRSSLHILIPFIQDGRPYENVSFPARWYTSGASRQVGMQPWQYQAPPQVTGTQGPPLPPTVKPPASFPKNTFDMSGLHEVVKAEFGAYHAVYNGNVKMTELCRKSGITLSELKTHPNFKNQSGGSTLCYIHVLGGCTNRACTRKHPKITELGAPFCADLCKQLKKGKEYLINNPVSGGKRAGGPSPARSGVG